MSTSPQASENTSDAAAGGNTKFDFEHKVFHTPGAVFTYSRHTKQVFFSLKLGEMDAKIPIDTLCNEINLEEDANDLVLLDLLRKGIVYVNVIRTGDDIPAELLDGSASWSIDDRHRDAAKMKLTAVTLDWLDGGGGGTVEARVAAMVEDEDAQKRVNEALSKIAKELKLGDKQKVIDRFEKLSNELAYLEALRDHYKGVFQIQQNLRMLQSIYGADRQTAEDINRMGILIQGPVAKINEAFQEVDGHTEDIKSAIRNFEAEIEYLRQMRDKLHIDSRIWEDMLKSWKGVAPEQSAEVEALLKETYRFLAQNFTISQQWGR
ncbi:MAG: hypothetical protein AAGC95_03040 [Pseudomonadota bacterium]